VLDGTNDLLPPCMDGELFAVGGLEDGVDGDLYESWLLSGKKKGNTASLSCEATLSGKLSSRTHRSAKRLC